MSTPAVGSTSLPASSTSPGRDRLLLLTLLACLLLLAQYGLGMVTNLFVTLPARHPGAGAPDYFGGLAPGVAWIITRGSPWAALHAVLGLVLVIAAAVLAMAALASRLRAYAAACVLGALTVLGAAFNGASFVNYGHDFSSMLMAGLWAVALGCYAVGLYLLARRPMT